MLPFPAQLSGKDLVFFLRKQAWLVGLVFALVLGTAVFYSLGLPSVYLAQAKIAIDPLAAKQALPQQFASYETYFLTNLNFETEIEILRSRPLAERVARALAAGEQRSNEEAMHLEARRVQGAVSVRRVENTRLIAIQVRDSDPRRAADTANMMAEQYKALSSDMRLESYRKSHAWLQEQIADLEGQVQSAEQELIDYVKTAGLAPSLSEAGPERAFSQAGPPVQTDVLQALQSQLVASQIERSRLAERYKPLHPKMTAINREIEIIEQKIGEDKSRRTEEARTARSQAISEKEKTIRYDILRRSADKNKQIYDALIAKLKESNLTADLSEPNIWTVEKAEPPASPVSPNRPRIAAVAAAAGLFLGLLLALGIEWVNPRIRSIEEFQSLFTVPVLASIPHVGPAGGADAPGAGLLSLREPQSVASEAFRTLRTNVKFSHAREDSNTLVVTSCMPREGKTTVSVNLAITLATAGRKVVLVDADLRNPGVHRELGMALGPGLAHLLAGEADSPAEVLRAGPVEGLSVIPAGLIPPNPSELLDSAALQKLMKELSEKFDQVIFDSPPVLPVSDASLLAAAARNVLLVFDMRNLNRTYIHRVLEQLRSAGGRIYGAALNQVEPDVQAYYYPGYPAAAAASNK